MKSHAIKASSLRYILLAFALAVPFGLWCGRDKSIFGIPAYHMLDTGGELFLRAFSLLVLPLISSAIISTLTSMNQDVSLKKLGLKAMGFYLLTIGSALITGLLVFHSFGLKIFSYYLPDAPLDTTLLAQKEVYQIKVDEKDLISSTLFKLVPSNIVQTAAQGNMLGVIFFSLLFGCSAHYLKDASLKKNLCGFWTGIFQVTMNIARVLLKFLPFGIFCLLGKSIAETGISAIINAFEFAIIMLVSMFFFSVVIIPLILWSFRISPLAHLRTLFPALTTAFLSSSSAATLPVLINCVENAGVQKNIALFVVPLGASMNLSGSALYEYLAILCISHLYGVNLSFFHQLFLGIFALLSSSGTAGIPSGSLVVLIILLHAINLPAELIAVIIPVDRLLDMFRTAINVWSDGTCAVLVAKTEGNPVYKNS